MMPLDPLSDYERQLYREYEAYLLQSAKKQESSRKIWGIFRFLTAYLVLSGTIFSVLLGILNFSAYSARVVHWINPEGLISLTRDIETLVSASSIEVHASEEEHEVRLESREIIEEKLRDVEPGLIYSRSYDASHLLDNIPLEGLVTEKFQVTPYENRIIIPRLGKNIPLVDVYHDQDADYIKMHEIFMEELRKGVVRYPGTARPGEVGNVFIFGHSSNYPWVKSEYNDVFALLDTLQNGDEVVIFYNQEKFVYKITDRAIVKPGDMDVLDSRDKSKKELALMTCWPIGTTLERIILFGELIEKNDSEELTLTVSEHTNVTETGATHTGTTLSMTGNNQ